MTDLDWHQRVVTALAMTAEHFRAELTEVQILTYAEALEDLTAYQIEQATKALRRDARFFPMASEIRAEAVQYACSPPRPGQQALPAAAVALREIVEPAPPPPGLTSAKVLARDWHTSLFALLTLVNAGDLTPLDAQGQPITVAAIPRRAWIPGTSEDVFFNPAQVAELLQNRPDLRRPDSDTLRRRAFAASQAEWAKEDRRARA